jgi:hypothetical protein
LGGPRAEDPGAPTINAKKRRWWAPWEVLELKIWECPPSTLRNVNDGPPGGAKAKDLGAPTINTTKHRRRPPEVLKLVIQERPPSSYKTSMVAPGR